MIYLIGVEHGVQSISAGSQETSDHALYRSCLEQAIEKHTPILIAEEFSDDALKRSSTVRGVPQEFFTKTVATENGVDHRLCDLDTKTKYKMGYQERGGWVMHLCELPEYKRSERQLLAAALEVVKDFPIRENHWVQKLKDVAGQRVVFVCGDGHIETFNDRLKANGISSEVLKRQIGMSPELVKESEEVQAYVATYSQRIEEAFQRILTLRGGTLPPRYHYDD
jgi:hypothetical protein